MSIFNGSHQALRGLSVERTTNLVLGTLGFLLVGAGALLIVTNGYDSNYAAVVAAGSVTWIGYLLPLAIRERVVISLVSVLVAAFVFNISLAIVGAAHRHEPSSRWVVSQSGEEVQDRAKMARALGLSFDSRSRLEVMLALRELGIEAWPSISPRVLLKDWWTHFYGAWPTEDRESILKVQGRELLPIGGISNAFTVYCNENGNYVTYQSDERGFANPKGMWNKPIDIAVVGDSFVHGGCVKRSESYVGVVRQRYPHVLNLGNDGIGPFFQLATIKEYLIYRRPKVVVWSYFCGNDLYDMIKERHTLLRYYLSPDFSQHLEGQQAVIDEALREHVDTVLNERGISASLSEVREWIAHPFDHADEWAKVVKLSYVFNLVGAAATGVMKWPKEKEGRVPYQPPVGQDNLDLFRAILKEAKRTVEGWGGKMVFVYLPRYERYTAAGGQPDREEVLKIVHTLGIDIVDMHPVFAEAEDPLELFPLRLPTHYSPAGYGLVADQLVSYLDSLGLDLVESKSKLARSMRHQ